MKKVEKFILAKKRRIALAHEDQIEAIREMIDRFGLVVDIEGEELSYERLKQLVSKGDEKAIAHYQKLLKYL